MSDRHEARLLLAILSGDWDRAEALRGRRGPRPGVFTELCVACDVHPWVHHVLDRGGRFELVGEEARDRLARLRHKCRMDNLVLLASLERSLDLLREAGIVPVVLKGLDVMQRFHSGFDARTLVDIDLLVRPREAATAIRTLESAGWTTPPEAEYRHWLRSSHHLPMASPGPIEVHYELHWNLVQEKRYSLDAEDLFSRSLPLEVAGRRVFRLADDDHVAFLFLHHLSHYFDRKLKWAVDIRQLAAGEGFEWRRVADRLAAWGGRAAAGLCALHLAKLFPDLIPAHARRLIPARAWRRLVTLPLRSGHPLDLFRGTRRRAVQLFLGAVALEHPRRLPAYLWHRGTRDRSPEASPVERASPGGDGAPGPPLG